MAALKQKLSGLAVGGLVTAAAIALVFILRAAGFLEEIELKLIDYRFQRRGPLSGLTASHPIPSDSLDIVIVDLDDESWRLIPRKWPYKRDIWARTVKNLSRAGASVIVFDIMFDSEDAASAEGDSAFAAAIRAAREKGTSVVLAAKYAVEKTLIPPDYIAYPISVLMEAGPETGLVGEAKDRDGFTRRYIAYSRLSTDTLVYLSLGMKAVKEYVGYGDNVRLVPSQEGVVYGEYVIKSVKEPNTFLINYYGPPSGAGPPPPVGPYRTFSRYPLSGVLDDAEFDLADENEDTDWMELFYPDGFMADFGMAEESPFEGKIAIVGTSVEIFLDLKQTPYYNYADRQQLMPGVETHANAIQTLLDRNWISTVDALGESVLLISLSLLAFAFLSWLGPLKGGIVALVELILFVDVGIGYFFRDFLWLGKLAVIAVLPTGLLESLGESVVISTPGFGESVIVPVVAPVLVIILTYGGNVLYNFVMEQRERRKISGMFSVMVSPAVLQHMQDDPDAFSLTGRKTNATMFFSDVAGFTTISEKLSAEDLAAVLNKYLSPMTEILMSYDGYVDKYEGDAIMCNFGVPMPDPEHARKACWAALDQQEALVDVRAELKRDYGVEVDVRMGINTGDVSAGNMGSAQRFSYTVMGDAVNQASRFEGANKEYGTHIMIGEETRRQATDYIETRLLDKLVVKGKAVPITVYELLSKKDGLLDGRAEIVGLFEDGLELLWKRDWDGALKKFEAVLAADSEDEPSKRYIERCSAYKVNPPPETWQGEFVMTTK